MTIEHRQLALSTGISMHVAEQGEGPAVVFVHGFPELGYSWRHQLPALAAAGFRAIAPDMRGYGRTSAPPNVEDYAHRLICDDLLALLDALSLEQAVFVGHDWGGAIVWAMAVHHPERVRAVAGINTPYRGQPPAPLLEMVKGRPGAWDYQFYFQEPGVAEAELEADPERTMSLLLRSSDPADRLDALGGTRTVRERGGILVGLPERPVRSVMLSAEDLAVFVEAFRATGFRGRSTGTATTAELGMGRGEQGGAHRLPGADGHGRQGPGPHAQALRGDGARHSAAAARPHRAVRPLDAAGTPR